MEERPQRALHRIVALLFQLPYLLVARVARAHVADALQRRLVRLHEVFRERPPAVVTRGTSQSQKPTLAERAEAKVRRLPLAQTRPAVRALRPAFFDNA